MSTRAPLPEPSAGLPSGPPAGSDQARGARGGGDGGPHGGGDGGRDGGTVVAAGALCWRPAAPDGGLELLLVRSARWGDWSWPKGKLEPGESVPACAVREVWEETGAVIELGPPLPTVRYVLPDGQPKRVHYWAGRWHADTDRTASAEEIAQVEWVRADAAAQRLTRPGDHAPLTALLDLERSGRLRTHPLLVLRHAKARSRASWPGAEADRPLTSTGIEQADAVAGLIGCWRPERLLCSPWTRCRQTLAAYLSRRPAPAPQAQAQAQAQLKHHPRSQPQPPAEPQPGAEPELVELLSERGLAEDRDGLTEFTFELLAGAAPALICTHRPVLAVIVAALRAHASGTASKALPDADPWLAPAELLVLHVASGAAAGGPSPTVIAVERHSGETSRKSPG